MNMYINFSVTFTLFSFFNITGIKFCFTFYRQYMYEYVHKIYRHFYFIFIF